MIIFSVHFIQQALLSVHTFIVGNRQDIMLVISIHHGKGHVIMHTAAVYRISLHISKRIVHPPHIPFVGKAQSAFGHRMCNLGEIPRFLGNHHHSGKFLRYYGIERFDKFHCRQIFAAAVAIRLPLSFLPAVIQIQHTAHRIYTQAVDMILLQPE